MSRNLKIALSNFRAFAETGAINIKPLTILVGENSTGKTSFLAALRFCFSLSEKPKSGYFNVYPFDLGSFEDIVHQSGQNSTNLSFSLTMEKLVDISKDGSIIIDRNAKSLIKNCKLKFNFGSRFGDVILSGFIFSFDTIALEYRAGKNGGFSFKNNGRDVPIPSKLPNAVFENQADFMEDIRQIRYLMFNLFYFSRGSGKHKSSSSDLQKAVQAFDAFVSSTYMLHSSPPVRSVPRRVYTSSDEAGYSDQTHAPHELNRVKRAERGRWGRLNSGLMRFGKLSGLFTRFDITKLTRQDAGPFQLKVTVRGRSSNIADVGYGVSQSLPIMTDLIESATDRSVFLFQQPEVHLHPKAQSALGTMFARYISENNKSFIIAETHSDYLIDRIRIEARKGKIDPCLVNILYFEPMENDVKIHELSIDNQGNVLDAPASYRQFFIHEQEEVLGI